VTAGAKFRPVPFTYREYCLLPEDGKIHELIEGDFFATPSPSPNHQTVSRRLQYLLMKALEDTGLAQVFDSPIDLILDDETVVQPDLVVISTGRSHLITKRGIEGVPELVVEVLSPSSIDRDAQLKHRVYERFGVDEYWIVDPQNKNVIAWQLVDGRYHERAKYEESSTLQWPAFPQVEIPLAGIFRLLVG